ncbi:uncharacterized protein LOC123268848 [Cotesia glomerata]|uniref:Uncharacterized protein n=1 Tax=Cotesia glomerata TaxID=32391 RepID=A0AAV7I2B2_COTGL|nr:uncharacterized protein LOC123268848 [Cotesia glomerata]KAH0545909.1 hypothetical protein KQX54_004336 [Cotesia glomerata]
MEEIEKLKRSLLILNASVTGFPVAAVTLDDYKPINEKIKELRESLNCLTARIKTLKIKLNLGSIKSPIDDEAPRLVKNLQNNLTNCVINDNAVIACHQSYAVQQALFNKNVDPATHNRIKLLMANLYTLNDSILKYKKEMSINLREQELSLKNEMYQLLMDYHEFLKVQEAIRSEKLAESNPEVAQKKAKALKLITKINMMKRLITNFISVASHLIRENPDLKVILKRHRNLIDLDSIIDPKHQAHVEESED